MALLLFLVEDDALDVGGGELSPSKSNVFPLLLCPLEVDVGDESTADALLNSSWGLPVFGLCPDD